MVLVTQLWPSLKEEVDYLKTQPPPLKKEKQDKIPNNPGKLRTGG